MPEVSEDFAGEFVLGALDADERSEVERRIRKEPDFRRAVDAWSHRLMPLLEWMSPVIPRASTWAAIQRRIGSAAPSAARRRADGVWLDVAPGAKLKMLHVDPVTGERTALMRMEPGCVYPEHDHPQVEECFVLERAVTIDGEDCGPGDYTIAQAGTSHGTIVSNPGGLVLLHWNSAAPPGAGLGR